MIITVLLPIVLTFLLLPPGADGPLNPLDEGIWLSLAQGLLDGKLPYKDIWFQYGPLLIVPVRLALTIDPALSAIRLSIWAANLLGLLAIYLFTVRHINDLKTRGVLAHLLWLVPLTAFSMNIPFSARYGAGFLPLLFWPREGDSPGRQAHMPWLCGLAAALACFVSQEVGVAAVVSGAWVQWRNPAPKSIVKYGGALAGGLMVGLGLLAAGGLLRPFVQCTLFDIAYLMARHRQIIPWANPAEVGALFLPLALYLAGIFIFFIRTRSHTVAAGLALYGLLTCVTAWGRTDRFHIYFALSPALVLAGLVIGPWMERNQKRGLWSLFGLVVVGGFLLVPHAMEQTRNETKRRKFLRPIELNRGGSAGVFFPQANAYEAIGAWVEKNVPPGEPVVFYPYDGALNFLVDRPFPGRFPILVEAAQPQQQEEMIKDLSASSLRWIIVDRQNTHFDGEPVDQYLALLSKYFKENFRPVEAQGPFVFAKRIN